MRNNGETKEKVNYMFRIKKERGITLVSLVITIVILIILAAVAISIALGEDGIISRVKQASLMNKKATYVEDIKFEIAQEQMDRHENYKDEAFITSLKYRLMGRNTTSNSNEISPYPGKAWVKTAIACDENGNENEDQNSNNVLIVTTKEDYDIYVDVDNNKITAEIREDVFEKTKVF